MANKLLSIVVPTKNRYYYLKYLIQLVKNLDSEEVEMVIQDNSDDNLDFVSYLDDLSYDFIRYDYIKGQIPMAINSDKAILNSTGEFVCFLGDDDGTTSFILDCAKWMKKNGVEAVKSAQINYYWPDITQGTQKTSSSAAIDFLPFTGKVKYVSPRKELMHVLKEGIPNRGKMPLVYHSIVRRDVLDKVYKKTGSFFPGNSPDISNAVALSLVVDKYAIIDYPLAFSGWSMYHGGGVHATGKKGHPEINEVPWFRSDAESNWDKKIPRIASGSMIWADSAISALKNMGMDIFYKEINFSKLYAQFTLDNPTYSAYVNEVCVDKVSYKYEFVKAYLSKYLNALLRRIGWVTGIKTKHRTVNNINNIIEAASVLEIIAKDLLSPFLTELPKLKDQ